jgi:trans-aconitate 2-methyltransferase
MTTDTWDPAQYNRYAAEREQPFWDLAGLLQPVPQAKLVDLGCGDGRLTGELHRRIDAGDTLGVDSSAAMLAAAGPHAADDVRFAMGDIATWTEPAAYDIVFANAALQWVPDHPGVLRRWTASLRPGGQLAVQVPSNADHPGHTVAAEVAAEFIDAPPADAVAYNVLPPDAYAVLLDQLGFERQHVRLQVYGHRLASTGDVVEWVKGTSLTRFKPFLPTEQWDQFIDRYRQRLLAVLGDRSPYFYPFKRILVWGRLNS